MVGGGSLAIILLMLPHTGHAQVQGQAQGQVQLQGLPPGVTADQVAQLLKQQPGLAAQLQTQLFQSGMTQDQIRQQLAAQGLTPTLLDPLLGTLPDTSVTVSTDMVRALQLLGVSPLPPATADSLAALARAPGMRGAPITRWVQPKSRVFGVNVFRSPTTQFEPMLAGPVPENYRVGPGDMMVLILTGDAEQVHQLPVTREGFVVIPQIGQLFVNNLTISQVRRVLSERLSRAFSGISRGTTHFDVTLTRLRSIQVYVVGDVAQPGAYQMPALSTVVTALYSAGGPSELGNFREIRVERRDSTVATFDLYQYLLYGSMANDPVLEQGDVVYVPVHGSRVSVGGAVVRPGIYELKSGDALTDAVAMAGGFRPDAQTRRVTVFRILPAGASVPGPAPRAAVDVPLGRGDTVTIPPLHLEPGDSVLVDSILPVERSLTVSVGGMVNRPGSYPWSKGMTVRDLVRLARGPTVGADLREGEIARLPADRTTGALATTLRVAMDSSFLFERDSLGTYLGPPGMAFPKAGTAPDVPLEPYDQLTIFRQPGFELPRIVWITGEVASPGPYALSRRDEHVSDLLKRAGGPLPSAYLGGARFFRSADSTGRVDLALPEAIAQSGSQHDLILQGGDSLYIPEMNATVHVTGAVNSPVSVRYVPGMGLSYYVGNAGGYRSGADKGRTSVRYADGSARVRKSFLFFHAYPEPGPGSTIFVPSKPPPSGRGVDVGAVLIGLAQVLGTITTLILVTQK